MLRFLVDAQLPHRLTQRLRDTGHEATHVNDHGLREAEDREIWRFAAKNGMVLVTKDEDFVDFSQIELDGPQIVWIRLGNTSNQILWETLQPILNQIIHALERGDRLIEIAERWRL